MIQVADVASSVRRFRDAEGLRHTTVSEFIHLSYRSSRRVKISRDPKCTTCSIPASRSVLLHGCREAEGTIGILR